MSMESTAKRQHRATSVAQLAALRRQRTVWLRKHTVASRKLADIARDIDTIADELARSAYADQFVGANRNT